MEPIKRIHLLISGQVIRVGFRFAAVGHARNLGLTGWVRNTENKEVEIVAEGSKEKLDKLADWVWEGPPLARVEKVNVEWEEARGEFQEFSVKK